MPFGLNIGQIGVKRLLNHIYHTGDPRDYLYYIVYRILQNSKVDDTIVAYPLFKSKYVSRFSLLDKAWAWVSLPPEYAKKITIQNHRHIIDVMVCTLAKAFVDVDAVKKIFGYQYNPRVKKIRCTKSLTKTELTLLMKLTQNIMANVKVRGMNSQKIQSQLNELLWLVRSKAPVLTTTNHVRTLASLVPMPNLHTIANQLKKTKHTKPKRKPKRGCMIGRMCGPKKQFLSATSGNTFHTARSSKSKTKSKTNNRNLINRVYF